MKQTPNIAIDFELKLKPLDYHHLELAGYCYSTEDHPLDFAIYESDRALDIKIVRVPAVELIDKRLATYDRACISAIVPMENSRVSATLSLHIKDLCSGQETDVPIASLPWCERRDLRFYLRRVKPYLRSYGFGQVLRRTLEIVFHLPPSAKTREVQATSGLLPEDASGCLTAALPPADAGRLPKFVLIVAEMSIPQCRYYRIEQKLAMLKHLGIAAEAVSWTDKMRCLQLMQTASLVIFYRVPFQLDVFEEYREAARLGLKTGFDVDDLIFDPREYSKNPHLQDLPDAVREDLLKGALMYQQALGHADFSIASTARLQQFMKKYCPGPSYLVPNAIMEKPDDGGVVDFPLARQGEIVIGYGSGTSTHDRDFALCSSAVLRILREYPQVRLTVHGMLQLPEEFREFSDRINRVEFIPFEEYSLAVKRFDINLVPLEQNCFNDCKSNIKYLEASRFGIPSVASPCAEFTLVIRDGENGFLARTPEEWYAALKRLVDSAALRREIGGAARETVLSEYALPRVAERDFSRMLREQLPPAPQTRRKKVLIVNVLYPPVSFGGATVVAENLADQYEKIADTAVFCVTTNICRGPGFVMRYRHNGIPVFAHEGIADEKRNYIFPEMTETFSGILETLRPDLVHFHSIQFMGLEMLDCCRKRNVPYVVTAHDAWWICERQFMLDGEQKFCRQDEHGIDLYRCAACTKSKTLFSRWKLLQTELRKSLLVLTPSDYMRDVHIRSGVPKELIRTNRNGIDPPASPPAKHALHRPLTFAYLGGKCPHKGYYFLLEVAERLHGDYRLKLVDVNMKFNNPEIKPEEWPEPKKIEVCPPFDHRSMDDFYAQVDVLLFPSECKESFGLTIREALARNVWVVSTATGGDIEVDLKNGVNGDLVPMYDRAAFRDAMQALIDRPERLDGYENPLAKLIRTPEQQFEELAALLAEKGFRF